MLSETRYIIVGAAMPEAYLYEGCSRFASPAVGRYRLVAVSAEPRRIDYLARDQAMRCASGLYRASAVVFSSRNDAVATITHLNSI